VGQVKAGQRDLPVRAEPQSLGDLATGPDAPLRDIMATMRRVIVVELPAPSWSPATTS
jgi:hypothetical protein